MEEIHFILHSLNRQQVKVLKKYLISFSTRNEKISKTWELAEYLLKSEKKIPTAEECSRKIYRDGKDSRIEKLKSRLLNKIFDALLTDINMDRKGSFDERDYILIKAYKKEALYQTLRLSTKHPSILQHIQDDIINISKKYELYSILLHQLMHKKWTTGWREGLNSFNKYNEEISFYERCNSAINNATDCYFKMVLQLTFEGNPNKAKIQEFLSESVAQIRADYEFTKSKTVGYFLRLMEMAYYQNMDDWAATKLAGEDMLNLIQSPAVYRKSRVGTCYDNIAECDVHLRNYELAIANAQKAQVCFTPNSTDYYLSKGLEFHANFYSNKIEQANNICDILLRSTAANQGDFRVAKYNLFKACVNFKLGKFKEALTTLSMKFELSKDKLGWEIAIRLLRIMAQIELGKLDEVQNAVISLQKHLERNAPKGDVHERDRMILRLMQLLDKEGFRKGYCTPEMSRLLLHLSESTGALAWQPFSPELIPIHVWMMNRFDLNPGKTVNTAKKKRRPPGKETAAA